MVKRKTKAFSAPLVECPFCREKVKAKELADHAKSRHANDPKPSNIPRSSQAPLLEGVEVGNADMVQSLNQLVVDESGILVNPKLLMEEHHFSQRNNLQTGSLSKSKNTRRWNESKTTNPKPQSLKTNANGKSTSPSDQKQEKGRLFDELINAIETANTTGKNDYVTCPICKAFVKPAIFERHLSLVHSRQFQKMKKEKGWNAAKPEKQDNGLVKCPLCKHTTQYKVLYVHIQVSHPEVNPKIVMAKFNIEHKNKKSDEKDQHKGSLNELVKEIERLKQSQDESRDGGKYMGHMRRERGKFGSLPLYDDYSDEANAE